VVTPQRSGSTGFAADEVDSARSQHTRRCQISSYLDDCLRRKPDVLLQAFASLGNMEGAENCALVFAGPPFGVRFSGLFPGRRRRHEAETAASAGELEYSARVQILGPVFNKDKWSAYRDPTFSFCRRKMKISGTLRREAVGRWHPDCTDKCEYAAYSQTWRTGSEKHDAADISRGIARVCGERD